MEGVFYANTLECVKSAGIFILLVILELLSSVFKFLFTVWVGMVFVAVYFKFEMFF